MTKSRLDLELGQWIQTLSERDKELFLKYDKATLNEALKVVRRVEEARDIRRNRDD